MPLELLHTIHPRYLEAQILGERTFGAELEETTEVWKNIFKLCILEDRKKVLVHSRTKGRFPLNAQINLSLRLNEIGCTREHRIAAIAYSSELYKNAQLIEKYMQSLGFAVRVFKGKEKARSWLLQEKKKFSIRDLLDSFD